MFDIPLRSTRSGFLVRCKMRARTRAAQFSLFASALGILPATAPAPHAQAF